MERPFFATRIERALRDFRVVAILGPRQCGKTTLARQLASSLKTTGRLVHHFDLEDPEDLARLASPKLALEPLRGLVILDEIQRRPDLFPLLRVLADRPAGRARFLLLGSASPELLRQGSESLAGRIAFLELTPFQMRETREARRLWMRGGLPRSYLARSDKASLEWRKAYVSTFLERDIPSLGFNIPPHSMRRFWLMLTHCHGQIFNASELGRSLGISDTTVRSYLDLLTGTFMVRQLLPWTENLGKRLVKRPKIYFRDTGILHSLLGLDRSEAIVAHPRLGASWEGFALETVLQTLQVPEGDAYFWATHNQAELDLLVFRGGRRIGFEFKHTDAPATTRSMAIAMEDLGLERILVIHPGKANFPLSPRIQALGLGDPESFLAALEGL